MDGCVLDRTQVSFGAFWDRVTGGRRAHISSAARRWVQPRTAASRRHGDVDAVGGETGVGYLRGVDQAFYRRHGRNMSSSYDLTGTTQLRHEVAERRLAFDSILEQVGADLPEQRDTSPGSCTGSWRGRRSCSVPRV